MHRLLILLACLSVAMRADAGNQTVPGARAVLLPDGTAAAPANAPAAVKNAIWAVNTIIRKPYRWGGGHATFYDVGYDCSGTVSFLLHNAGVLDAPTPSKGLLGWAESGTGHWITVTRARATLSPSWPGCGSTHPDMSNTRDRAGAPNPATSGNLRLDIPAGCSRIAPQSVGSGFPVSQKSQKNF